MGDEHRARAPGRAGHRREAVGADLAEDFLGSRAVRIEGASGPRHYDELGKLGDAARRPPRQEIEKRLGPDEQQELIPGSGQRLERVDRVRRPGRRSSRSLTANRG